MSSNEGSVAEWSVGLVSKSTVVNWYGSFSDQSRHTAMRCPNTLPEQQVNSSEVPLKMFGLYGIRGGDLTHPGEFCKFLIKKVITYFLRTPNLSKNVVECFFFKLGFPQILDFSGTREWAFFVFTIAPKLIRFFRTFFGEKIASFPINNNDKSDIEWLRSKRIGLKGLVLASISQWFPNSSYS